MISTALTFIGFVILFTVVGLYSSTQKQDTTADYLLAGRTVGPWLVALSALSTGQSGFLFTAQVGYAYTQGISSIWLAIGWAIGDYLSWLLVFKQLRETSEASDSETVPAFLAQKQKGHRLISAVSALITIFFLGAYAAAQLLAGSKALSSIFGWNYAWGVIIGAVIVVAYCFSGGIRASIWTDAVQTVVMIGALLVLLFVTVDAAAGIGNIYAALGDADSRLVALFPPDLGWGFWPFFIGWIVAGFGGVGQPHIVVRAMALDSAEHMGKARDIRTICGLVTAFSAIAIGLAGRVLLPQLDDPELALLALSSDLLPGVLVGVMLAGLFAATISTADSQILSCSAALTQDLFPKMSHSYRLVKVGTLVVTAIVLAIALANNESVFRLIIFAWSILASGLGVLLVLRSWQKPVSTACAITMMLAGVAVAVLWRQAGLSGDLYEVLPGMAAGLAVYAGFRLAERRPVTQ
ncbi:sodium/proline symporter [cf. Phormidesmis sp. LEGE 11477]|uniref:sodium/proline symporter n=1 Tax=cf. Phormidesmis sp. LEGE 11477 TaxID=1828680 RepID=UPI00187E79C9|nr:sodium/proline symporter [cf. Phormidesmis sp. LEGE 11477]MBE9061107.1 sodium/proline symporter [cf. Phormidesmis sp. LEGE 11477]